MNDTLTFDTLRDLLRELGPPRPRFNITHRMIGAVPPGQFLVWANPSLVSTWSRPAAFDAALDYFVICHPMTWLAAVQACAEATPPVSASDLLETICERHYRRPEPKRDGPVAVDIPVLKTPMPVLRADVS